MFYVQQHQSFEEAPEGAAREDCGKAERFKGRGRGGAQITPTCMCTV